MTETGLLIAQAAVLLLLFGFMAALSRSAGRQLARAAPPPAPLEDPVDRDTAAHPVLAPPAESGHDVPAFPDEPDWPPAVDPFPPVAVPATDPFPPIAPPYHDDPFPPLAGDRLEAEPVPTGIAETGDFPMPRDEGQDDGTFLNLSANLQPRLVVENGPGLVVGTVFPLGQGLTIGRSRSNELHVDDTYVSHMHARILKRGPYYYVEDLGSTNGTFVNDGRVEGSSQLRVRDTLRMGETILRYEE